MHLSESKNEKMNDPSVEYPISRIHGALFGILEFRGGGVGIKGIVQLRNENTRGVQGHGPPENVKFKSSK